MKTVKYLKHLLFTIFIISTSIILRNNNIIIRKIKPARNHLLNNLLEKEEIENLKENQLKQINILSKKTFPLFKFSNRNRNIQQLLNEINPGDWDPDWGKRWGWEYGSGFNKDGTILVFNLIEEKGVADFSNQKFSELKFILISLSGMTRIKGISKLKNLQSLLLMNNNLKCMPNISELKNLRHLDLFNNKLKDKISFTNNNYNIEALNLGWNNLTSISGLENLNELWKFSLEKNNIQNIEFLKNKKLKELYLGENNFSKLDFSHNLNLNYINIEKIPNLKLIFENQKQKEKLSNFLHNNDTLIQYKNLIKTCKNKNKYFWIQFKINYSKLEKSGKLFNEIEDFFEKHKNGILTFKWNYLFKDNTETEDKIIIYKVINKKVHRSLFNLNLII